MAKVKGPLFSIIAMGRVGEDLVYRKRKKISDVKKYTKTINPNTPGQQTQKGYFQSAILAWQTDGYSSVDIRAWDIYARAKKVKASGFNMFTGFRMSAEKAGKAWEKLTNCSVYDVTGQGFKVDVDVEGDFSGKLYLGTSRLSMLKEYIGIFSVDKYTFEITGLSMLTQYYFYIKNTAIGKEGRTGIYRKKTTVFIPIPIDIGSPAIVRNSNMGANTIIVKGNPANATGKITSVEIYAYTGFSLVNCEVATFYNVSGNNFSTRDHEYIGAVASGAKRIFAVDLDVQEGDYIGIRYSSGYIYKTEGGSEPGLWYKDGDHIPCTNQTFAAYGVGTMTISLYGIGSN